MTVLLQVGLLRDRLPAAEVEYAIEDALLQAGHAGNFSALDYTLYPIPYTVPGLKLRLAHRAMLRVCAMLWAPLPHLLVRDVPGRVQGLVLTRCMRTEAPELCFRSCLSRATAKFRKRLGFC